MQIYTINKNGALEKKTENHRNIGQTLKKKFNIQNIFGQLMI